MRQLAIWKTITMRTMISDCYFEDVNQYPLLSIDEEVFYTQMMKLSKIDGDFDDYYKYRNLLINSNLRFVISVAKQYQNQGLSLPDLINEGNIGLIKAVDKFDETRGFKLISYAVWWIRQIILMAIAQVTENIRVPMNKQKFINRVIKVSSQLEQRNEFEPNIEMIAEVIECSVDEVLQAFSLLKKEISISDQIFSSDAGNDGTLEDLLFNEEESAVPDYSLEVEDVKKVVHIGLRYLKPKQLEIIKSFFGIDCEQENKSQIARRLGLTPEAVRITVVAGLKKLQKHRSEFEKCLY